MTTTHQAAPQATPQAAPHAGPHAASSSPRTPDPRFNATALYDIYRATLTFRDKVCGGTPKNPDLLRGWIAATTEHDDATTTAQVDEARAALLAPTEEKSWNGFRGDETGLYLEARQIKALFRECATMLRVTVDKRGSKQIFQHGFEIKGSNSRYLDRLYLGVKEPSGCDEGPIHVDTPQGPRTAIKRVDFVAAPTLSFEIWVLSTATAETRHIGEKDLVRMLTFAQENGCGADRSQGRGKFDVTGFEVLQKAPRASSEDAVVPGTPGAPAKAKKAPKAA